MSENNIEIYKNAIEHVWKDGIASIDEYAMLDVLREKLKITPEQHLEMEILARKKSQQQTKIAKTIIAQQKFDLEKPPQKEEKILPLDEHLLHERKEIKEEKEIKPVPPPLKEKIERKYPCSICGQPLIYISQYKRWYCYNCRKYA